MASAIVKLIIVVDIWFPNKKKNNKTSVTCAFQMENCESKIAYAIECDALVMAISFLWHQCWTLFFAFQICICGCVTRSTLQRKSCLCVSERVVSYLCWNHFTLCNGMMSLSLSFWFVNGWIMSFLIIFSTHSIVTTSPLCHRNRENKRSVTVTQIIISLPLACEAWWLFNRLTSDAAQRTVLNYSRCHV